MSYKINVPVGFCVDVASNNQESEAKVFLIMKMLFKEGKLKLSRKQKNLISEITGYKHLKSLKRITEVLIAKGWVKENKKTGYFILTSLKSIKEVRSFRSKLSSPCILNNLNNFKAFLGGVIFTYCYKMNIRRAIATRRSESKIYGGSYHSPSGSSKKKYFAEVSVLGVEKLFGISKSKAGEMRSEAIKEGYIEGRQNLLEININLSQKNRLRKEGYNVIVLNGRLYEQQSMLIYPLIYLQ